MPRNPKKKVKLYTEVSIVKAMKEVHGKSIRETALKYHFSRTLLTKQLKVEAGKDVIEARGRKPVLSADRTI